MKLFEISPAAKIVEPAITGLDTPFVYLGSRYAALLLGDTMPDGTSGLIELDARDLEVRQSVTANMLEVSSEEGMSEPQRQVYDRLFAKAPRRVGTPREFLHLFSSQEKTAFFEAARQNIAMEVWWAEACTGDFSLDHPSVEAGLEVLVQSGLLSADRMAEILSADFDAA